jgi:hypothetical protein
VSGPVSKIIMLGAAVGLTALLSVEAQSQPAPEKERPARRCFHSDTVSGFSAIDDETILITSGRRTYELKVLGHCPDLDWTQTLGLRTVTGSTFVCTGMDVDIVVPRGGMGPDRCPVRTVRELSEDEVKAMKASRKAR